MSHPLSNHTAAASNRTKIKMMAKAIILAVNRKHTACETILARVSCEKVIRLICDYV